MPTVYGTAERVKSAVFHLALNRARAAVKRQLQARGERLAEYSARELTFRAEQYLAQNREALLASAMAAVEQWTADGFFGKRAQRDWESVRKATGLRTLAPSQPRQCEEICQ